MMSGLAQKAWTFEVHEFETIEPKGDGLGTS